MADMTQTKKTFLNNVTAYATKALALSRELDELTKFATDNTLVTGANAIVDGDCTDSNAHLMAAIVGDAMTAFASVTLSTTNATRLRKASNTPVPK